MKYRQLGKALQQIWCAGIVFVFVIADTMKSFEGTWISTASDWLSLLLIGWLILFAIGVSKGEPNP